MNRIHLPLAIVALTAALVVSAAIVRNGLLAIAGEIRNKPMLEIPRQVQLTVGDSKVNLNIANVRVQPTTNQTDIGVSIDNLTVGIPSNPIPPATIPAISGEFNVALPIPRTQGSNSQTRQAP